MYVCMYVRTYVVYMCIRMCVYMYVCKAVLTPVFPLDLPAAWKGGGGPLLPGQQLASHTFCPGYVVPLERLPFTGQATQPPPQMPLTQPGTNPLSPKTEGCR